MLQQTRVAAVLPYYERFLEAFPTLRDLACASEERVLARWSGLGYYARARNLRRAAREIVARHGGALPDDGTALERLPGIGPYTRGALLSLCFDRPHPVVDGNVERVLARWFAIAGDPKSSRVKRRMWSLAASLLPPGSPAAFNQAMMELGARVCTPRAPACERCPVALACRALAAGRVGDYPARRRKSPARRVECAAAIVESARGVFLVRREEGANRGLYDLPAVEDVPPGWSARDRLARLRAMLDRFGISIRRLSSAGEVRHGVMERNYVVALHRGRVGRDGSRTASGFGAGRWVGRKGIAAVPLTARARKALELVRG